jgi:ubiquinone/menaquinone biosynthesis C-methylase UbiE
MYRCLDAICLDLNYDQLNNSRKNPDLRNSQASITSINGTANLLPFADHSIDRIVALESHHHFLPLNLFIGESKRVLEEHGLLIIASPIKVTDTNFVEDFLKLGFLSLTLQSKNYLLTYLKSVLADFGFQIKNILHVGSYVFRPMADYYIHNRGIIKQRVAMGYPLFIEKLLCSMVMKSVYAYNKGMIDYLLINCSVM